MATNLKKQIIRGPLKEYVRTVLTALAAVMAFMAMLLLVPSVGADEGYCLDCNGYTVEIDWSGQCGLIRAGDIITAVRLKAGDVWFFETNDCYTIWYKSNQFCALRTSESRLDCEAVDLIEICAESMEPIETATVIPRHTPTPEEQPESSHEFVPEPNSLVLILSGMAGMATYGFAKILQTKKVS